MTSLLSQLTEQISLTWCSTLGTTWLIGFQGYCEGLAQEQLALIPGKTTNTKLEAIQRWSAINRV